VAVITGDQYVGPEAEAFCPGIAVAQVKESLSRYAASHLHPLAARELIQSTVQAALSSLPPPPSVPLPATVEVDFLSPDMAEQSTWVRGVSRVDSRTVSLTDDDPLRLFRTFITLVYLTRSLVES
jgi:D-amino peptidase